MRVVAPANRRTQLVALVALLVVAFLASGHAPRAAVSSGERASAGLPAALWGVEVDARAARTIGAKRLAALRKAGINALVADPARVRGRTLTSLRRRAARARLIVLTPRSVRRKGIRAASVARAMCRRAGRCVVMAPSAPTASRLSRTAGVDLVVVRVGGPKAVAQLGRTPARRLLALARLVPSPRADAPSWRAAIGSARGSTTLDLAVTPVGARSAASLDAYLALLREQRPVKPPPPPPPPPPPVPPGPSPPPPPGGSGGVPVYTKDNPPPTPSLDQLPKVTALSKDGVTWTFSEAESVGQFITGDYYVVGNATVTAISPAPANGRNGSVKNLPPVDSDTGFDSRTEANRYEAGLRVPLPVTLVPGDSLVSSISVETVGQLRRWLFNTSADSPVKSISILTSVSTPLPPDAFRPSYVGKGAPVHYSRNLRRDVLPKLAAVASLPSLGEWEQHFRRPWVDNLFFNFDSPVEYMPDYAREIARAVGTAGLLLSLSYTAEQKEPLLVYLTQYGIDLYGLVNGGHPGWPAHGGHGSGRKFPIVFAGTLLEVPAMQSPPGKFGEDMQTMAGTGWTGAAALYAGHYGNSGSGQYGPYEHLQPSSWPGLLGEDYRRCCTSSAWIGEALAARLVPGMRVVWNHTPFFAYADRWMTEDDTQHLATIKAQTGKDYSGFKQRKAWDAFATNMWKAYRG
jgi:predicted Fe-Mo cluster-binding NifX family protein